MEYLRLSRSIDCQPEQVLITGNYATSMDLILRTLAQPGQHMWMEDPGYPFIRPVVEARQLVVDAIPVDDEGMDVGWGLRHHPQARFALLTPAHQSPLGSRCRCPGVANCWRGRQRATRGLLRTITIVSFAITANRCRQ